MGAALSKRIDRKNLAFKHAEDHDLKSFFYSVSLGAFQLPRDLSRLEARVLTAACVLSRARNHGFIGLRCTADAGADFVQRVTGEKCGRSSWFVAMRGLVRKGYFARSRYGGGKAREVKNRDGSPRWLRDLRSVFTFTDKALCVWSCPTVAQVSSIVQNSDTYELPKGSLSLGSDKRETPARDIVVPEASPALDRARAESPAATVEPRGLAAPAMVSSPNGSEALQSSRGLGGYESRGSKAHAMGRAPRHVQGTTASTRTLTARALLSVLRYCAETKGREGRAAVARAALELADPRAWNASPVPWEYWLDEWGKLSQAERRRVARSTLLPALAEPVTEARPGPEAPCREALPVDVSPVRAPDPPPPAPASGSDILAAMLEAARAGNTIALAWLRSRKIPLDF